MESSIEKWLVSSSNQFRLTLDNFFILGDYQHILGNKLCLALPNGTPKFLMVYTSEIGKRDRIQDLFDLEAKESLKDLIIDLTVLEVLEIVNSLLESTTDEPMNVQPNATTWDIIAQRAKVARVPFNRRILNDISSVMKAIEVDHEKCYSLDPMQFSSSLQFEEGKAFVFNEAEFAIDNEGVVFQLKFDQRDADTGAKKLNRDLNRVGLSGIDIAVNFPAEYPFSPPKVRILRPRLRESTGFVIQGGICMQLLDAAGWSPALSLIGVVLSVHSMLLSGHARLDIPEEGQCPREYMHGVLLTRRSRELEHVQQFQEKLINAMQVYRQRKTFEITTGLKYCSCCLKPLVDGTSGASLEPVRFVGCDICNVPYCNKDCQSTDKNHNLICSLDAQLRKFEMEQYLAAGNAARATDAVSEEPARFDVHAPMPENDASIPSSVLLAPSMATAPLPVDFTAMKLASLELFLKSFDSLNSNAGSHLEAIPTDDPSWTDEILMSKCRQGYSDTESARAQQLIAREHKQSGWHGRKQNS